MSNEIEQSKAPSDPLYVLVTPVRNEEKFIERTIKSVIKQTVLPQKWVIVSDGSTDNTDPIVERYCATHAWIELIKLPQREFPSFAAVVENTTLGITKLAEMTYNYLGLLDSDLEFPKDYFELLIKEFEIDPQLGLAGGVAIDIGLPKDVLPRNKQEVPGALQFFRKECFEAIGGIIPVPEGGWDCLTCAMARMRGYTTRLVTHLIVDHLKPRNTIHGGALKRKWQMGVRDYILGYHPLFELVICTSRAFRERPIILGTMVWFLGYLFSFFKQSNNIVPKETIAYIRSEQLKRLFKR